jgi:hypothetical protein
MVRRLRTAETPAGKTDADRVASTPHQYQWLITRQAGTLYSVIPAKAGISDSVLYSGFRRDDSSLGELTLRQKKFPLAMWLIVPLPIELFLRGFVNY